MTGKMLPKRLSKYEQSKVKTLHVTQNVKKIIMARRKTQKS